MTATITLGKSGRIVVPKAIRDSLGIHEGSRLRLEVRGGKIEAVPEEEEISIIMKDGFPVIRGGRKLGAGEVVDIIRTERDERDERLLPKSRKEAK